MLSQTRIINIVFLLNVFCFLKLIPFIKPEVQAYGGLISVIYLLRNSNKINKVFWFWLVYLSLFSIYNLCIVGFDKYIVLTFITFVIPVASFFHFYEGLHKITPKVFKYVVYVWTGLAFSQLFFPGLLKFFFLDKLFTYLIPRFSSGSLAEWNRGVVIFTPEPSYAAHIIFLFISMSIYMRYQEKISKKAFRIITGCNIFMIVATASGTAGVIVALLIFFYLCFTFNLKSLIVTCVTVFFAQFFFFDLRFISVFSQVFKEINSTNEFAFSSLLNVATALGSTREFSVSVAYSSLFNGNWFGYGIGSWSYLFLEKMFEFDYNPDVVSRFRRDGLWNLKPYSYGALVAFDLGLLGYSLFIFMFRKVFMKFSSISAIGKSIVSVSVLMILFHTLVSLPVYWITLSIGLTLIKNRKSEYIKKTKVVY